MPENALLTQILNDYLASDEARKSHADALTEFCVYASNWLTNNNCIGVGRGATGVTLLFSDGRALSLFGSPEKSLADQPAVPISTAKDKLVTKTVGDSGQAVQITGR